MDYARMHGAGNSFVVINNMDGGLEKARLGSLAEELCAKYGTDGILVTMPADLSVADFGMLYYNADGSLGEMCGNGARCIARFGYEHGLAPDPSQIRILATAGVVTGRRVTEELYEIRLNDPTVAEPHRTASVDKIESNRTIQAEESEKIAKKEEIPDISVEDAFCKNAALAREMLTNIFFHTGKQKTHNDSSCAVDAFFYGGETDCAYVELGDPGIPHAVVEVPEKAFSDSDALRKFGRALRYASVFPKGANVTFACKIGERRVRAITFERGVEDFTLACGTGCGATAVSLALRNRIPGNSIEIDMPGGHLSVRFDREGDHIYNLLLTGPTAYIGK